MESRNKEQNDPDGGKPTNQVGMLGNLKNSIQKVSISLFKYSVLYPVLTARKALAGLLSGIGFGWNFLKDIFKAGKHHLEWKAALGRLQHYLKDSGIQLEMNLAMNERFITNISVYDDVQRELKQDRQEDTKMEDVPEELPSLDEGAYYMRFATAAYGSEMIGSSVVECNDEEDFRLLEDVELDDGDEAHILAYTSTKKEDVVVMDIEAGGSMEYLRHYCVVDHNKKALVFAIRGTFSLSGLVTDLVGFCEPFCDGQAHCGMAEMAKATWEKAKEPVLERLRSLPKDYDIVITGHSLGAGVACLVTILLYHEKCVTTGHKIRCMAYAPPPVFCPFDAAQEAVDATVAYIHNNDVVPFLSVHNVRRFFDMVIALDDKTKHMSFYEKVLIDWDVRKPTNEMVEALRHAQTRTLARCEGAEQVGIPAKAIIWLREPKEGEVTSKEDEAKSLEQLNAAITDPDYIACVCDANKVLDLSILINLYMITDHLTSKYENALRNAQMEGKSLLDKKAD